MDQFTRNDLKILAEAEGDPAVSIYMPTMRAGREVRQNPIRFKNLIRQVEQKLTDYGVAATARQEMIRGLEQLEADSAWWEHQADGLAIFLGGGRHDRYRLPLAFDERVVVGKRYHVAPLVTLIQNDGRYYVLAVSQNDVRLLLGSQYSITPLDVEELPSDLRSALNIDEYMSSLQHHTTENARVAGNTIFHGHGASDPDVQKKDEIRRYFQQIDKALNSYFGVERVPLVFAGVDYLFPIFRETCSYSALVAKPVEGNPDHLSPADLHEKAWEVVEPMFSSSRDEAISRFEDLTNTQKALDDLGRIIPAIHQGAVETLLLAEGEQQWGLVDEQSGSVRTAEQNVDGAQDLINYAITRTLAMGGDVYVMPRGRMPREKAAAAVLRFELPG